MNKRQRQERYERRRAHAQRRDHRAGEGEQTAPQRRRARKAELREARKAAREQG